jgi:hypothetical protein
MAFWSPPASADPDLKQQLFDFKVCENLPERTLFSVTLNFPIKNAFHRLTRRARDKRTSRGKRLKERSYWCCSFVSHAGRAACTGPERDADLPDAGIHKPRNRPRER